MDQQLFPVVKGLRGRLFIIDRHHIALSLLLAVSSVPLGQLFPGTYGRGGAACGPRAKPEARAGDCPLRRCGPPTGLAWLQLTQGETAFALTSPDISATGRFIMDDSLSTTHEPAEAPFVPVEDMQPSDTQAFTAPMHLPQAMQQQAWTEGHADHPLANAETIDGDRPRSIDVATAIRHRVEEVRRPRHGFGPGPAAGAPDQMR